MENLTGGNPPVRPLPCVVPCKLYFSLIVTTILSAAAPAVFEEFLVRGLAFAGFMQLFKRYKYDLLWAAIASSLLFGVLHLSNLAFQPLSTTMQQVFYTSALGFIFALTRIMSNGMVLPVIFHFLVDFKLEIVGYGTETVIAQDMNYYIFFSVFIPIALVGIISIWKLNKDNNRTNIYKLL